jgi:hypothetical protein
MRRSIPPCEARVEAGRSRPLALRQPRRSGTSGYEDAIGLAFVIGIRPSRPKHNVRL